MATQVKLPQAGPLSLLAPEDESASTMAAPLSAAMTDLLSSVKQSPEERWRDEQLAFAGGMADPSGNGSFGGALTSAFKSQSQQRTKNRELQAQYLPTVINALVQQQQLQMQQQQMRQLTQLMGGDAQGASWAKVIADKYGIPLEAIVSDVAFNGGKNIREMIYKRGTPDIELHDGVAIDKNLLGRAGTGGQGGTGPFQGFLPGVRTSANGQTSVIIPGGPTGVRVVAPEGAADITKMYADIGNRSAADFVTEEVTPRGENPQLVTRSQKADLARGRAPGAASAGPARAPGGGQGLGAPSASYPLEAFRGLPPPQPGMTSSFEGDPEQIMRQIADLKDPQERANALDAFTKQRYGIHSDVSQQADVQELERQMREAQQKGDIANAQRLRSELERARGPKGSVGMELKSPAEAAREAAAVEAEGKKYVNDAQELRRAKTAVSQLEKAIGLLEKGSATASGLGSMRDAAYAFVGKESESAAAARELATIQGWLTANVPRMEGPQSNFDVMNYQQMTGMVGNEKLPLNVRLAAAKSAMALIKDAAPKTFGAETWNSSQIPTATPFQISPDIIKAERERRRQGAK